ncbi:MAG: sodium:calcium antiporter [Caldiserica bacterium]|nr:MAG: sodium:calcium antiporter [Caldisericota bacterium]
MLETILLLILGIAITWTGAEIIIWTSKRLSLKFGISIVVISLTVVAAGTSLPEASVSWIASFKKVSNLALGNVIGSCIINIGMVLGIGAMILPLNVEKEIIKFDYPVLLLSSLIFFFTSLNGIISRAESFLYLFFFLLYIFSLSKRKRIPKKENGNLPSLPILFLFLIFGFILLFIGGKITVIEAVIFAKLLKIDELIIGVTVVAFGTSIPELAVVVLGGIRGVPELSIGTIVGSNIVNILLILGGSALINPVKNYSNFFIQSPSVLFFTAILFPLFITGRKLSRFKGFLLFTFYVIYSYLILK